MRKIKCFFLCLCVILCLRVYEFSPNGKLAILSELAPVGPGLASGNLLCHISRSSYILYISFVISCISQSVAEDRQF